MLKEVTGKFSLKFASAYNVKNTLFIRLREVLQVKQPEGR